MRAAVFLDRDGVINENRADYVKKWEEFVFLPNVFEPLRRLAESDLAIIIVTNQSAIGRGVVSQARVEEINQRMVDEIHKRGGRVDAVAYCPHRPDEDCRCRKPRPGLFLRMAEQFNLDLTKSYCVGNAFTDVAAGQAVGCFTFLVRTGRAMEPLLSPQRLRYPHCRIVENLGEAFQVILSREAARIRSVP